MSIVTALRAKVFALTPADLGLVSSPATYGLVIETALPDTTVSWVALADGSVSIYASDGNGCIGCGANVEVHGAAIELLRSSERYLPASTEVTAPATPSLGNATLFFLTPSGIRATSLLSDELGRHGTNCELYFAAQRLIQTVERVGAGHSLKQEIERALMEIQACNTSQHGAEQCLSVGNVVCRLRT
ncbi:MAG: hypothetical protein H7Y02_02150 [Candidatus Obscuribacterales bacterium]|nr:hypothetical protein [Steroidobacteraceae bacterium]